MDLGLQYYLWFSIKFMANLLTGVWYIQWNHAIIKTIEDQSSNCVYLVVNESCNHISVEIDKSCPHCGLPLVELAEHMFFSCMLA